MICGSLVFFSIVFVLVLIFKFYYKLTIGICRSHVCLVGKTAIVTGANTGLGYETALDFAKRGAKVIIACRNESKALEAVEKIKNETHNNNVHYKLVNFGSFKSVREFAKEILATEDRLDILVNNAGAAGMGQKLTEDGIPLVFQINYLSHFLLTNLLIDLLKKNPSRVVNVSSMLAAQSTPIDFNKLKDFVGPYHQYNLSKLCQILFTIEFAERFRGTNVTAYSLHPGFIRTNIFKHMYEWQKKVVYWVSEISSKTPEEGAQTQIHCSLASGLEKYNGQHFHDCQVVERYENARDVDAQRRLWMESAKLVGLK